jgi:hypothetical protein
MAIEAAETFWFKVEPILVPVRTFSLNGSLKGLLGVGVYSLGEKVLEPKKGYPTGTDGKPFMNPFFLRM